MNLKRLLGTYPKDEFKSIVRKFPKDLFKPNIWNTS